MSLIRIALLLLITNTYAPNILGQIIGLRNFNVSDGLPSSIVYHACEDKNGFIWLGTDHGVSRYDGHYFDNFTTKDGLPDNEVLKVFADQSGRVWFLALNGKISYYYNGVIYNEFNDPALVNCVTPQATVSFFEDYFGNLWFSSQGNYITLLTKDKKVVQLQVPVAQNKMEVAPSTQHAAFPLHDSRDSTLYIYFNQGVFKFNYNDFSFTRTKTLEHYFYNIFEYSSQSHATYYDEKQFLHEIIDDSLQTIFLFKNPIHRYLLTENDELFIAGKNDRLETFDHNTGQLVAILENCRVNSVMLDHNQNVWFCTRGKGLYFQNANAKDIDYIGKEQKEDDPETHTVIVTKNRNILWGENGTWLGIQNLETGKTTRINLDTTPDVRLINLLELEDHRVAIGLDNQLMLYDENKGFSNINVYRTDYGRSWFGAKDICVDHNQILWYTTSSSIYHWDTKDKNQKSFITNARLGKRGFSIAVDYKNRIWSSCIDGLFILTNPISEKPIETKISDLRFLDLIENKNNIMIGASENDGLMFFQNDLLIKTIPYNEALGVDLIRCIAIEDNTIWCGSNKGIKKLLLSDNLELLNVVSFGENEGLLNMDVRKIFIDSEHVYAATNHGLLRVPKNKDQLVVAKSNTYIRAISGTWGKLLGNKPVEIDYLHNNLFIEFSCVSINHNNNVVFQYSIDDTTNWATLHSRNLSLNDLPFGDHSIHIRSQIIGAAWSKPETVIVHVIAPFWKTTYFAILSIVLIFAILALIFYVYSRTRILKLKQISTIKAERERISIDLHDDVGADLTRIALMAERLKEDDDTSSQKTLADKIISNAGGLRQKADQIIWALNPIYDSTSDLAAYLHYYGKDFFEGTPIQFHFHESVIDKSALSSLQRRNLFLIMKEGMNNALKHSKATDIHLSFLSDKKEIKITLVDNGKGIEASNNKIGMKSMRKRASEINADFLISPNITGGTVISINLTL
jgi:signal transduction histidine kinase/ligand-binding sensor domain-containing protein